MTRTMLTTQLFAAGVVLGHALAVGVHEPENGLRGGGAYTQQTELRQPPAPRFPAVPSSGPVLHAAPCFLGNPRRRLGRAILP